MAAVTIVALDFALIPAYGPHGAAAAMVITTASGALATHWLLVRHVLNEQHGVLQDFLDASARRRL